MRWSRCVEVVAMPRWRVLPARGVGQEKIWRPAAPHQEELDKACVCSQGYRLAAAISPAATFIFDWPRLSYSLLMKEIKRRKMQEISLCNDFLTREAHTHRARARHGRGSHGTRAWT